MKIYLWQRYFLWELGKSFATILMSFYALYVIIDYANQLGAWRHQQLQVSWQQWILYYLCELMHRADVLLPFALLLATLRTLSSLNNHGELVTLLCSGISLKTLLRPFLECALLLTIFLYINAEYGVPAALEKLKIVQKAFKKKKHSNTNSVQEIALADGSRLLYHSYDEDSATFHDLFWIQSDQTILRMRKLWTAEKPPRGTWIEELKRDTSGEIALLSTEEERTFPSLILPEESKRAAASSLPELQPLTQLWQQLSKNQGSYSYREAQLATAFYQKMILPWLCLLAIAITAPYCVQRDRRGSSMLLYAAAVFGLVAFYLLLDAIAVLGRRQIVDPAWVLLPPFGAIFSWALYNYTTLR